jgi:hypothetical protein
MTGQSAVEGGTFCGNATILRKANAFFDFVRHLICTSATIPRRTSLGMLVVDRDTHLAIPAGELHLFAIMY